MYAYIAINDRKNERYIEITALYGYNVNYKHLRSVISTQHCASFAQKLYKAITCLFLPDITDDRSQETLKQ